jgi:pimeloyl-ACP methyl ester carboxylesterase
MARVTLPFSTAAAVNFPNGTVLEWPQTQGAATQLTSHRPGLRSAELPAEFDTSPLFERALEEHGIFEQETIYLDALAKPSLRSDQDRIVLRPAISAGDTNPRVVLYQDESGGVSWHFAEGSLLTPETRERMIRRGLRPPQTGVPRFVIEARTEAAREGVASGLPRGSLRGIITKLGRKILKVFVIPITEQLLSDPVQNIVGTAERKIRRDLIFRLTPESYRRRPDTPFSDWNFLGEKPTLLVIHGLFSTVDGMLGSLPHAAIARWSHHYQGRVIGFNHLTVSVSPEENARFFLNTIKNALPDRKVNFDVLCHSRGGIVARVLAERGQNLLPESKCDFRKVYFVATPNQGSQLGDPKRLVDLLDVYTNFLTNFPDGHALYAVELVLAIVKLLAYTAEKRLPGIDAMGTCSYIEKVLNRGPGILARFMPQQLPTTTRSPASIMASSSGESVRR